MDSKIDVSKKDTERRNNEYIVIEIVNRKT